MNEYAHLILKHKMLHKKFMYVVNGGQQQSSTSMPSFEGQ